MVTESPNGDAGASGSAPKDEHDNWLDKVDASHVPALKEDWDKHAFWADDKTVKDPNTEAGKVAEEMSSGLTPDERAESAKVSRQLLLNIYVYSMGEFSCDSSPQAGLLTHHAIAELRERHDEVLCCQEGTTVATTGCR